MQEAGQSWSREGAVVWVDDVEITVAAHDWAFASAHERAIEAHWLRRKAANPRFFNGTVHLMRNLAVEDGRLTAHCFPTEFRNYLYWRDMRGPDASVIDGFGSALVVSADGGILVARQQPGFINTGLYYPPGGFIDQRDVTPDRQVDIVGSVLREVEEETGLSPDVLAQGRKFAVTRLLASTGPMASISLVLRSRLPAEELRREIRAHLASESEPELDDVLFVKTSADLARLPVAEYCVPLFADLLGSDFLTRDTAL
ncbi:MAG: NUDIX domain-containing protein [Hyphomicrobiaceae bacterium]